MLTHLNVLQPIQTMPKLCLICWGPILQLSYLSLIMIDCITKRQQFHVAIQIMIKKGLAHKYPRQAAANTARLTRLENINKTFHAKNKPESAFTSISSLNANIDKVQRKININDEIINKRKQNHLNTQYNRRLNNLKTITKQNKKIYERINSQKSLYSQEDMRRSSVSIRSLSKSNSRVSNRSGTNKEAKQNPQQAAQKPKIMMTIQPQSLGYIKQDNIKQFKSVFMNERPATKKQIGSLKVGKSRSFSLREDHSLKKQSFMGNILHKIAEEMYEKPGKKLSYSKRRVLH